MKTIFLLLLFAFSTILFAQEEVKLKNGKAIIIFNNGTWKYKQANSDVDKEELSCNEFVGHWININPPQYHGASYVDITDLNNGSFEVYISYINDYITKTTAIGTCISPSLLKVDCWSNPTAKKQKKNGRLYMTFAGAEFYKQ